MYRRCKTESRLEDKSILEYNLTTRQEWVQPLDDSIHLDCSLSETTRQFKAAFLRISSWYHWSVWRIHYCQRRRGLALGKSLFQKAHFGVKVALVTQGFEADAQEKYFPSEVQVYELPALCSLCFGCSFFFSPFPFFSIYNTFHSRSFSPLSMLF